MLILLKSESGGGTTHFATAAVSAVGIVAGLATRVLFGAGALAASGGVVGAVSSIHSAVGALAASGAVVTVASAVYSAAGGMSGVSDAGGNAVNLKAATSALSSSGDCTAIAFTVLAGVGLLLAECGVLAAVTASWSANGSIVVDGTVAGAVGDTATPIAGSVSVSADAHALGFIRKTRMKSVHMLLNTR